VEMADDGGREKRYFDFVMQPARDTAGSVTGVLSFGVDVTERVRARRRLESIASQASDQQRWLEMVLDFLPTGMLLMEPGTGRLLFVNRAARALVGGRLERFLRSDDEFYAVDAQGNRMLDEARPLPRAVRGEPISAQEAVWATPDGRRAVLFYAQTVPAIYGHPATVVVKALDITRLKTVEEDLSRAVRVRDQFLAIASHELRTPLTSLRLEVQGLLRASDTGRAAPLPALRGRLQRLDRLVERQAKLIQDLLDVSRFVEGRLDLRLEEVDLASVAREVVERFHEELARSKYELTLRAAGPVVGRWDATRLDQIVTNLLSNAMKYGRGKPIEVAVEGRPKSALLTVRDHGIGIRTEDQQRIFERFGRAVSERSYGGFGLGLWLTRQIVEALGGRIAVASRPNEGALFTVELPRG
jgi:signal transduction histidine kinase